MKNKATGPAPGNDNELKTLMMPSRMSNTHGEQNSPRTAQASYLMSHTQSDSPQFLYAPLHVQGDSSLNLEGTGPISIYYLFINNWTRCEMRKHA